MLSLSSLDAARFTLKNNQQLVMKKIPYSGKNSSDCSIWPFKIHCYNSSQIQKVSVRINMLWTSFPYQVVIN